MALFVQTVFDRSIEIVHNHSPRPLIGRLHKQWPGQCVMMVTQVQLAWARATRPNLAGCLGWA